MTQNNLEKNKDSVVVLLQHYLKLEATDKLTVFATFLLVSLVIFALGTCALFFLCFGLVKYLGNAIGSESNASFIIGGVLIIILLLFFINRVALVERPLLRWISASMLDPKRGEVTDEDF